MKQDIRWVTNLPKRVGVTCPECGAGGASTYIPICHICTDEVLMLPSINGRIICNWGEFIRNPERVY